MANDPNPPPPPNLITLEAQLRTAVSVAVAAIAYVVLQSFAAVPTRIIASWDSFAVTMLTMTWISISFSGIDHIRHRARSEDLSRFLIFLFTVAAACASVFAVVALLSAAKKESHVGLHAALSVVAVISSWVLVHTMFTLRYAHYYYGETDEPSQPVGGLEFPSDDAPDYIDFAYFSFVIGMTAQVSDVQITSKSLRALALVHGILSFCFNTVILALTINTISGLL